MDPTSAPINPTELYELLGIVGGVIVSGLLGFVVVRRARASRQRMIDAVGEAPAPRVLREAQGPRALEAAEAQEEPEAETGRRAREPTRPSPNPRPPRASPPRVPARSVEPTRPAPEPERAPAQVIPFPARRRARKGGRAAARPARTRSGFIARLGEIFAGKKEIDPSVVDEIEKVLLTADIGVRTSQQAARRDPQLAVAPRAGRSRTPSGRSCAGAATEMLSLPAPPVDFGVGAARSCCWSSASTAAARRRPSASWPRG